MKQNLNRKVSFNVNNEQEMKLLFVCLLILCICSLVVGGRIHKTNHIRPISDVGILVEYCEDDKGMLDEMLTSVNETLHPPTVWTVGCHRYIEMANHMLAINQSAITHLIVAARRESLRFIESMLSASNIKESTAITTNNELMVAGKIQTSSNRKYCKDRAGGKQFWGLVVSLLPDIIDYWQWRNLYLYVDEVYGLSEAKQVYDAFQDYVKVASINLIQTTKSMKMSDFLKRISSFDRGVREVKAVIVICGREETSSLVEQASKMGLFSTFYRWLIFDSGSTKLLNGLKMQYDTDVVIMRHDDEKTTVNSSVIKSIEMETINASNSEDNSKDDQKKISCLRDNQISSTTSKIALNRRYLPDDLKLKFFRVSRRVYDVPSLKLIGKWTPQLGLSELVKDKTPDLDGVVLQVVALHCPPYVNVIKGRAGNVTFEGYLVDIMAALGKMMNFRFNVSLPYDHTYGRCDDGICTGIIGFLVRKEADLALANLTPTGSRVELMDFSSTPIDKAGLGIIFRRPTKTDENIINAYFMPFSMDVSICVGASIPFIGILLYVILRFGYKIRYKLIEGFAEEGDLTLAKHNRSLGRCMFAALQSFGQQGVDVIPGTASGRVIFGVMWLFSLFIMSAYTANLISYFTATFVSIPFKSFDEMFRSRKYKIGFMKGTTYMDDIQGENGTILMKLWKQLEKQRFSSLVEDLEEGLERVRNEKYIFMHESRVLEHVASKDCEFATLSERYLSSPMMLAFQKDSQFKRPISDMLLKMAESGLLEKLKNRWWPPTMDCALAAQTFQSISLWGMTSIFSVLAIGLFIGIMIMLLEKCIKAQKLRSRLKSLREVIPANIHVPSLR